MEKGKCTYLVTGGAGFIGTNYILYMFRRYGNDIRIINLDKLTYAGNEDNLKEVQDKDNYRFVQGDICDASLIRRLFTDHNIERVVHFAAESHVDRSIESPAEFVRTNVLGTQVLLEEARRAWEETVGVYKAGRKFLHVSTDEVFGSLGAEGCFLETSPYDPHNPYAASKAAADMLVKAYMDTYRFPANITNCGNNYGPYQFPEKLIPLVIAKALRGEEISLYGDGKNVRDWIYVEDHVRAIDMVMEKGRLFGRYNIGASGERENIEIIREILRILKELLPDSAVGAERITYVADRKGHDRRYALSADKIKRELCWESKTGFKEGLRKTVQWYLEHRNWLESAMEREEH